MPRAVSNVPRLKRKKQIMKAARGAFGARSKLWKAAKENVERGWKYAYRDRKNKKRDFRQSVDHAHQRWRPSARAEATATFINGLKKAGIEVNRKILADLAVHDPGSVYRARRQGALRVERSVSSRSAIRRRQRGFGRRCRRFSSSHPRLHMRLPEHPTLRDYADQIGQMASAGLAAIGDAAGPRCARSRRGSQFLGDRRRRDPRIPAARSVPSPRSRSQRPASCSTPRSGSSSRRSTSDAPSWAARRRGYRPPHDLTMPARQQWRGAKHPVTLVIEEIAAIFRELGFTIALGPEAESEWYNFGR